MSDTKPQLEDENGEKIVDIEPADDGFEDDYTPDSMDKQAMEAMERDEDPVDPLALTPEEQLEKDTDL